MKKTLGICLGSWSISFVRIIKDSKIMIEEVTKIVHNGNPTSVFNDYLLSNEKLLAGYKIIVTGRKFRHSVKYLSISETLATEYALKFLAYNNSANLDIKSVATLGAETFLVYNLDVNGNIKSITAKNKCASGTGEFYLQQLKRMDVSPDLEWFDIDNVIPYKVSGRCSVFCKSDCTHAINKGIEKKDVIAGLAWMLAEKIEELLPLTDKSAKILLVGGVSSNKHVIHFLRNKYQRNIKIPKEAEYFEALGAGLYGIENNLEESHKNSFNNSDTIFSILSPIYSFTDKVTFKEEQKRNPELNEECVLGLDVGSTTTKAVLISLSEDNSILASEYIYTNGNPIEAAKKCYTKLLLDAKNVKIIGLGTTGSGRHIAALHAKTEAIFNEITAHCAAAVHYDSEVDTIFEIGGQDAKYSFIVNKVPTDYAMNEACSAGTGSFIEEAAFESLGINVKDIEKLAMQSKRPPNFSEQCAAFISSDIKTAQQAGISKEDIIAGLTYSICYNYLNRVKGNRPVGKKVFMQGGVCYNKAIPIAMAGITNTNIIIPHEPGLMGAFGTALKIKEKLSLGLIKKQELNLNEIIKREIKYLKKITCNGGNEKCDLKCNIFILDIDGKKYFFGGACDKYNGINSNHITKKNITNFVNIRNQILLKESKM